MRRRVTRKQLLQWLLLAVVIAAAAVLAFGNNIGYAKTLPAGCGKALGFAGGAQRAHQAGGPRSARHLADSQSVPIPASTASGGSSS